MTAKWWLGGLLAFFCSASVSGQITYTVDFNDPTNAFSAAERATMTTAVQVTGADWARYFQTTTPVTLSVRISLDDTRFGASGRSGTTAFVNTVAGIDVFEQSAARKVRTGTLPFTPPYDIELTMNQNYLRNNLYFEPIQTSRTGAIPASRTDAYAVFVHEIGHAFTYNGWRNNDGTLTTGTLGGGTGTPFQSTWDRFITVQPNGDILSSAPSAVAVYGGSVPVTNGNPNHIGNSVASGRPGSDLVPPPTPNSPLVEGLFNGVFFHFQTRYSISALDLAFSKDAGITLAPFRWTTAGSGEWHTPANWNFSAAAGPNIVVPATSPLDARIDGVVPTPYTVTLSQNATVNSFVLNSANATLSHTANTFATPSATLTNGLYRLDGGQISNGTWTGTAGNLQASSNVNNRINNSTLGAGLLNLTPANSYVRFLGNTNFATNAAGTQIGTGSTLGLSQASLDRGTININGGAIAIEGTGTVILSANVTISVSAAAGTGTVGAPVATPGTGNLINQGILQATGTSSVLTINPTGTLQNSGTIRTTDPSAMLAIQTGGGFTNTGTVTGQGTITGNVINNGGGQFTFSGNVTGNLAVSQFPSQIDPGLNGPGLLQVGSANFGAFGTYRWQIKNAAAGATPGVDFDHINSNGNLSMAGVGPGQFRISIVGLDSSNAVGVVSGFNNNVTRSWVIADFGNDLSSISANRFVLDTSEFASNNLLNGGTFSMNLNSSGELILVFSPVPEPSILLPIAMGLIWIVVGYARMKARV
jgi:hypothetical protein